VRITVEAHAKINLHLQVLARRADGYHDVATVLQSLALADTLMCEARPGAFELRASGADVPLDESNLIWRAARLIANHAGRSEPGDAIVTLDKRIPMQAGLGGGSADAAAALMAFARLWRVPVDREELVSLARRLGADVPFCLEGGTALGRGRGDELTPLADLPPHAALIVMPPFGVSTSDAYRWHDERVGESVRASAICRWPSSSEEWDLILPSLSNDFEPVVSARFPEVAQTVAALRGAGARFAALSGSGAAIAGLFGKAEEAEAAATAIVRPGWRTFVTRTIGRRVDLGSLLNLSLS
jgi:4-diphosphocytidyl-2-C-methyl-D-erythritol kinase